MPSIIEFLEARITEDEAIARASAVPEWSIDHSQEPAWVTGLYIHAMDSTWDACIDVADAEHAVRHDPARVLAECEAKRAIIKQHKDWPVLVQTPPVFEDARRDLQTMTYSVTQKLAWLTEAEYVTRFGTEPPTAPMVRTLAAIYKDHPDYQQEWAA